MKKRYFERRPKDLPKGYDSKLEYRLHQTALQDAQHHPNKSDLIPYTIPHTYEYDFMFELDKTLFLIETKGRFRDSTESRKYLYIRDNLDNWHCFLKSDCDTVEMFFIFANASTPMPFSKKRKDGTKQTHGEWASRNNFRWLCEKRGDLEKVLTKVDLVDMLREMNK